MRIREIKHIFDQYSEKLYVKSNKLSGTTDVEVVGLQKAINEVDKLASLGFINPDLERLKTFSNIYHAKSADDRMRLDANTHKRVLEIILNVKEKVEGFSVLLCNSIPSNENNVVSVKLPPYNDLEDLSKLFSKLDKALRSGLKNNEIKGNYHLQNFDTGSIWIDLAIASGGLTFLGKLIETAQRIQKNSQDYQITKRNIERMDMEATVREELTKALEKQITTVVDSEIHNLTEENIKDPEAINDIKYSIRLFSELLHEGTQFYAPLNAPEEITQSFPEFSRTNQLDGPQSLLENLSTELENQE